MFLRLQKSTSAMARGNQRDLAREKAQKKAAEKAKGRNDDGLTPQQRRERYKSDSRSPLLTPGFRDARLLQEKAARKAAQKAEAASSSSSKK